MRRRGFTFLETIVSAVLLAGVALAVFVTLNSIVLQQTQQRQRLTASEIANRLVIIYLDDANELARMASDPFVENEREFYRWSYEATPVDFHAGFVPTDSDNARIARRGQVLERFTNLSVTVWLSERSGGAASPGLGVPTAHLVRLNNPIPLRNPDSLQKAATTGRIIELLSQPVGGTGSRTTPNRTTPSGSKP